MNDKNNNNNDLPDWLDDLNPEENNTGEKNAPENNENVSNDDWLNSLEKKSKEKEAADSLEISATADDSDLPTKNKFLDPTEEFLYEIENMIDDRSYLNLNERADRVADGNEWLGWEKDETSDDDNDDWLANLSQKREIEPDEAPAFSEEIKLEDDVLSISEGEQKAISLDDAPNWLKEADTDAVMEDIDEESTDVDSIKIMSEKEKTEKALNDIMPTEEKNEEEDELESLFEGVGEEKSAPNDPIISSAIMVDDKTAEDLSNAQQQDLPDWLKDVSDDFADETDSKKEDTVTVFENTGFDTGKLDSELPDWLREEFVSAAEAKGTAELIAEQTEESSDVEIGFESEQELELLSNPFLADGEEAPPRPKSPTGSLSEELEDEAHSVLDAMPSITDDALEEIDYFDPDNELLEDNLDEKKPFTQDMPALNKGDLPDWVKSMRPSEIEDEAEDEIEAQPLEEILIGPLAGFRGIIPAEPEIVKFSAPASAEEPLQVSSQQSVFASLLEEMFDGTANKNKAKEEREPASNRGWLIIPIFMVLALMAANFINIPFISAPMTAANNDFANSVRALPVEANVLLALDYQLGVYQEIDTGIYNLMVQLDENNSHLYTITTQPMGNGLANMMIDDYPSVPITSLGYLTGNASAIAKLAYDVKSVPYFEQLPATMMNLDDFDLVVVATDNIQNLQNWAEQAGPALTQTPLLVVSSVKIKPIVEAYYQTSPQRVNGYLSGYFESITYQRNVLPQVAQDNETWDGVYLVTVMVILLIMLGSMISLMVNLFDGLRKNKEVRK